jgi:hypothetical protein
MRIGVGTAPPRHPRKPKEQPGRKDSSETDGPYSVTTLVDRAMPMPSDGGL